LERLMGLLDLILNPLAYLRARKATAGRLKALRET
jgi:hypothetical protein